MSILNRHQTILGVYVNKFGKTSVVLRYILQINRTKWYCSKLLIKWVITTKKLFLHSLCYLSEPLSLVACKQRADHFTPIMWFYFIRWRFHFIRRLFHYSNLIKYNQNGVIQNCISSETHNWYMYNIWDIETQNLRFPQMPSLGEMGGRKIFACLSTYRHFVEQPVVS